MRWAGAPAAVLAAVLAVPTAASAVWSATGGGSAAAPAGTLAPPATTTLGGGATVSVSWTASPSEWTSGYRVLRGVTAGALTQIGADQATAGTLDDSPGAGTHYYAVVAYRNGWTSQPGTVVVRSDRDYVLTGAAPTGGTTGCSTAASITGIRQGHVPTGAGVSAVLGTTSYSLCTDAWSAGQSLPAGTTTMAAYVANTHNRTACSVGLAVRAGTTVLGTATVSVNPGDVATAPVSWLVPTIGHSFTTGQRVTVTLTPAGGQGCTSTTLRAAGAAYPSKVTLTS